MQFAFTLESEIFQSWLIFIFMYYFPWGEFLPWQTGSVRSVTDLQTDWFMSLKKWAHNTWPQAHLAVWADWQMKRSEWRWHHHPLMKIMCYVKIHCATFKVTRFIRLGSLSKLYLLLVVHYTCVFSIYLWSQYHSKTSVQFIIFSV